MTDILRRKWKFTGYVTSDCWAIDDFFKNHKTHKDAATASADAVFHGTDLDCGTDAYKALITAVKTGIITEKDIDISVKRLFMIRFRLGMFDPASMVKYANTPISILENEEHKAHALKMARASMVLLRNENHTLPLRKNLKKLVILGPNADNEIAVLGNYNGIPSKITTVLAGIKDKVDKNTQIVFEKAVSFANDTILNYLDIDRQLTINGKQGFKAEYYKGTELKGEPVFTKIEKTLNLNWQEGEQIDGGLTANNFSARYTTQFKAIKSENVTFELDVDDGYRLIINGKKVLDAWSRNRWGARTYQLLAKKDSTYQIEVEYWQGEGSARIRFAGGTFQRTDFDALVKRHQDADAFIFVGGISPQLEGEEMKVDVPGFNGGDRTSIMLPEVQTKLMKALKHSGKPVIFVMMTGSAIATPWEAENIPAIVNAWYGGQSAGTAVAELLFGDYSPSGRLPVTFYKSDKDLADFNDYNMENRTYRYFKGKPLFGFGYGLSYTSFQYQDFKVPANIPSGKEVNLSVKITNTGKVESDEIAQLYVMHSDATIKSAKKVLKGFQRVSLAPGASKMVSFKLLPDDLSYINADGEKKALKGKVKLSVGGSQPDEILKTSGNIVSQTININ